MTTVLRAAWRAAGSPSPQSADTVGPCARCGAQGPLAKSSVSKTFTAYDDWGRPGAHGTCAACTWGFTTPGLRQHPHLITANSVECVGRDHLGARLLSPVGPGQAFAVPLRPGRKHVLPAAQWGRVTTEMAALGWGSTEAARLSTVFQLRQLGATAPSLFAPAPPFTLLRDRTTDAARVMDLWQQLRPWRPDTPWLYLAVYVARAGKNS